nr:AAA family ATPase [Candidatus Sigynarchaeota archaeon]
KAGKTADVVTKVDLDELARITYGYSGADLAGLVREAINVNLRKNDAWLPKDCNVVIPEAFLENLVLSREDFIEAKKMVNPSTLRGVRVEVPMVTWDDVGGLEDVKQQIVEAVSWHTTKRDAIKKMGIRMPRGILLYGPPGSGKTLLAKAAANEGKCNFIAVKGPELVSKWLGDSEKHVRELFATARQAAPCIIFFDEFDSIAPARQGNDGSESDRESERMVTQLLTEMDGIEHNDGVVLIATTNRPDLIDPAILRKGRIDRIIHVPIPDKASREKIVAVHLRGKNLDPAIDQKALITEIGEAMDGFTGADIEALIMEAGISGLRAGRDFITRDDIFKILNGILAEIDSVIAESEKFKQDRLNYIR